MSLKSGLEQNATCINQVMERGETGWSFTMTPVEMHKGCPHYCPREQRGEGMPPVGGV